MIAGNIKLLLIDPSIGIALASLLSFKTYLPIAFIVAPLVSLYGKNYRILYRQRINQQQWQIIDQMQHNLLMILQVLFNNNKDSNRNNIGLF